MNSDDVTRRVIFLNFLDIDGVLAPIRRWDRYGDPDPACIRVLNEIVAGAGADVVVSSTWRHGKTVAELQEMLEAEGFTGCVIDKTPTGAPGADRADEIAAWLAEHAVGGYVIIDDHGNMGELRTQLVLTHPARGLQGAEKRTSVHKELPPDRPPRRDRSDGRPSGLTLHPSARTRRGLSSSLTYRARVVANGKAPRLRERGTLQPCVL